MRVKAGRYSGVPMSIFSRILDAIDNDLPLPKPKNRWWERGNCKDVPLEERDAIFFPAKKSQVLKVAYKKAHEYCKYCPVKKRCLESAIEEEGRRAYGYRGDMDHRARRILFYDRKHKGLITKDQRAHDGLFT